MRQPTVAKVTISLPPALLALADSIAKEREITRSGVIAELLEQEKKARFEAKLDEGYREWAEENRRLAEESFPLAREMMLKYTRWDDEPNG